MTTEILVSDQWLKKYCSLKNAFYNELLKQAINYKWNKKKTIDVNIPGKIENINGSNIMLI